jgi:hypothetical protein
MKDHMVIPIGGHDSIFSPARQADDRCTGQSLPQVDGEWTAQIGSPLRHPRDTLSNKQRGESAHSGFDFRKLWHGGSYSAEKGMSNPPRFG